MAGLFSSNEQDMLGTIMQQRGQSNQALGSGYGKYGGIVQAGAGMADIGGDAMFGGATGASDPRMIEQQEVKAIFSQASTQTGNSTSPEFYMAFSELLAAKFPEQSQKAMEQAQKVKQEALKTKQVQQQMAGETLDQALTQTQINKATISSKQAADLKVELGNLGENPTDEQLNKVLLKYGDPTTLLNNLQRKQTAKIAAESRADSVRYQAQARRDAAQVRADAAKEARLDRASAKLLNKPKDVAEMESANVVLRNNSNNLDKALVMLEGTKDKEGNVITKPTVNFALTGQLSSAIDSLIPGSTLSDSTKNMASIRKIISKQVQLILQASKGTQTEGDAQRASDNISNFLERNSNDGMANAIRELQDLQNLTLEANDAYVSSRGYGPTQNSKEVDLNQFDKE